ncbi:TetR/AcrR family transcriptional regulator [Actinokineospora terrae]|uniref:Transcriptional regulator, TetR family n=1 Tax=Actinokineospora terrae TaxID=155974 RepID=A0A1H9MNU9_9PSEU|nr:TetR/AcrR family transcriptional regulator [Actinokineospora terrae]SER25366.1 transcriptional regulator, TetR family [Actinokineospora terrae]
MTAAPGSRKRQAELTEIALKAAARQVFARKGFVGAKISDITTEAGRASGSFYNHFASKEALLESLLTDWIAAAGDELTQHGDDHDLSDPEHLHWHVAAVWRTYREHGPEIRALREAAIVDPAFAARLSALRFAETHVLREHLQAMRHRGHVLPGSNDHVASAMLATLTEFCQNWILDQPDPAQPPLSDDEAIDTLTAFLLHGISGPA